MKDSIAIRPGSDDDGDAIAAIIAAVFAGYPDCPFDRAAEFPELDRVAGHFAERGGRIWVAEADNRVIGCFAIAPTRAEGAWEIFKVYLLPAYRGRGVARRMLAAGLDFARRGGAVRVRLWSDTRFAEGHAFYRKCGFERLPVKRYLADLGRTWEYCFVRALGSGSPACDDA